MPTGSIWIAAALAEEAAPLAGVRVTVLDESGVPVNRLETDENGVALQTGLAAPDRSYSLDEANTTVRPYAVYDLVAEKDGWQTVRVEGVQVFDGQQTVARLAFLPADGAVTTGRIAQESNVRIPPHPLFSGRGGSGPAPAGNCPGLQGRVLKEVVIPKTITVHLGRPSENARNVTVSFQEYIATVASGEVYPTWARRFCPRRTQKFQSISTLRVPFSGGNTRIRSTIRPTSARSSTGRAAACCSRRCRAADADSGAGADSRACRRCSSRVIS